MKRSTSCQSLLGSLIVSVVCGAPLGAPAATTNAILFVTQVPMPTEINSRMITGSTVNVSSPFGNHLGDTAACGRGGALMIRYPDGSITNLTLLASYGVTNGFQGANSIAVREPSVHWSGAKALFSMVVGAPTSATDTTRFFWQMYEISHLGQGQLPTIAKVPNQPTHYNNVSPAYGTDGRIIFASDRPRDGSAYLYPQREEYLQQPTVTGLWSLDPNTGDLFLLEHSPSGSFKPFVDSFGRVIFTRWDHLARDVEAVTDRQGASTNNVFNYSDESASALVTTNTTEVFPEPRPSDTNALVGTNMRGNAFNQFFPWSINEDGTGEEVVNHVGRHELIQQIPSATFTNDPNIVTLNAAQRFNTNYANSFFVSHEDPSHPGLLYGVDALDLGTHTAGQIVTLTAATNLNADVMTIGYLTPKATSFPNPNGLYRNPLPMSNGLLVAVYAPHATNTDANVGSATSPKSFYDFRLRTMKASGGTFVADAFLTPGISNTVGYFVGANAITYTGPMWELDPVEVAARPMPQTQATPVAPVEAQVFADMGVDLPTFQDYLRTNELALVVSRNATARDHADRQQPYNLKVAWSGAQTLGANGTIYSIAYLQLMQADQLRGFKPDGVTPAPGRRVLAQPWHDSVDENPPVVGGPTGSVQLGNDGSFAAIIPARRAMSWQTVDTNGTPIVRERYWVTFQPGEVRTCANCHGINTQDQAGNTAPTNQPEALKTLLQWWKVVNLPQTPGTILFQTFRDGNHEIYSMNPDGSNVTNLTQNPATDAIPRVSYDGKKVVFMSDRGHPGNMDIWTMNNDGTGLFNVSHTNLPGATIWAAAPNFDGSKIVYMGPHTPNNRYDIFTCNADGTGVTDLTASTGDGDFPYWSYDGSKIVFGSYRDNPTNNAGEEIYIMNANGSGQKRLTFTPGRDFYPVISPDGRKIAFTSERDGHRQIYLMNTADGSGQTNISKNAFNDQNAYFSPDGTRISFTSDRDGGSAEVYVMNADGSGQTRLTTNTVLEAYPAWGNTPSSSPPPPPPTTFALTVNNGNGSGSYTNGAVVSISANASPSGQVFDQWTGATVANPAAASTTLTMPASNTAVTAAYKLAPPATFNLTVVSGSGSGSYTNGSLVAITANPPPSGQIFSQWTGATVAIPSASSTTLVMPASNTTVTATYVAVPPPAITYTLTVNNGSGSGTYTNGQVVGITASAAPAGQVFNQWTGATVANPTSASTTLTMPGSNTSVTATYKAISGSPYDVGPGWPYPTLGSVPWMSLLPGDIVNIHYQAGGYHEIVLLSNSGNATNHIIIRGIADPQTGALPVIDGQNAVTAPGTPFRASIFNILGSIVVSRATGTAYGYIPSYIDLENLHVQNANMKYTLTDVNGVVTNFHQFATAIYVEYAQHLTIRNCELNGSGNGFFVNSKDSVPQELSSDVLVERCWIHHNGNPGSYSEHNIYTECNGITFQYNLIGPIALGANGEDIKDRSAGTVIRYNKIIQDNGPGHAIWILQPQGGLGQIDVQPTYPTTYIYGNVILGGPQGGLVMVRYDAGGDMQHARKGPHYFYNNTVINYADQSTKWYISALMTPNHSEIAGLGWDEVVDARNNLFVNQPQTPGATPTDFALLGSDDGILNLGANWISPGYHPYRLPYQITSFVGQINGLANLLVGDAQGLNNPHFVDLANGDYNLASGANAIDAGGLLAPAVLPTYDVTMQYLDPHSSTNRVTLGSAPDLGALESSGAPPTTTFALTVVSGSGSGSYTNGQVVGITANAAPAGQVFSQWKGATVANPSASSTTLSMPGSNTTVTATYKAASPATFTLAVVNGSGSGSYTSGAVVPISANAPPAGQVFNFWYGATVAASNAATTTLTMPATNTTVYAVYKNLPGTGTLQFGATSYSVNENAGSLLITVTRANGSNGTVGVSYTTLDGTAKTGQDYINKSGTLTWTNGDTSAKGFVVTILADTLAEGTETFGLMLGAPTGGATIGSPATATVSILDVAPPPPSTNGVIVFMSTRTGNNEVFSMNPDGSNLKNLTANSASDAIPNISADGTKIAFASDRGHPNTNDIWVMNADGSNPVNLTHTNLPGTQVWGPALNAHATQVAYMGPSTNGYDIYVANLDGSNAQNLTRGSGGDFPSWSPDGTKIAFSSFRDQGTTEEIYVMNAADGSNVQRLTFATGRDMYPVFSPDGTKIAFTSERDGNREVYLMNADGSGQTNLTKNAATDQMPSFSPDGTKIVFDSTRDGNWELYTMNLDGSVVTRITSNSAVDVYPSWGGTAAGATTAQQTKAPMPNQQAASETIVDGTKAAVEANSFTPTLFAPSFDVGFCPQGGQAGQAIVIVGLHFTGVTEVWFNGVPAKFSVKSDQIILTKVPKGATTGPITLIGPGGEATMVEDFVVIRKGNKP